MPFLGNRPAENYISYDVQHFTTSATTSYTLDHAVANENELRLVINNVVQQPGSSYAYSASGTSLTLTSATSATDTMYCVYLGKATSTVNPPSGSVAASQLVSDAVTAAKLNDDIISGQTALASEPADTDEFLVSDAGTLKRIDYSLIKGGGITNVQSFVISGSDLATSGSGYIQSNIAANDQSSYSNVGTIVSQSSGTFSFSATGYYLVTFSLSAEFTVSGSQDTGTFEILVTTNNSSYTQAARVHQMFDYAENTTNTTSFSAFVNVDDTSNVKVRFGYGNGNSHDGIQIYGSFSDYERTQMQFIRLGDSV